MHCDTNEDATRQHRELGQTMAEYAIALAVITPAIIATIALISGEAGEIIDRVTDLITGT